MSTKGDILDAAFAELALSDDAGFELTPGERTRALRRLDGMLATWAAKGVRVSYSFPANDNSSDENDASGLPDSAFETVALNLARRIAPSFGKTLNPETLKNAREGYDTLLWQAAHPVEQQLPHTMPRGMGNKPWRTINRVFIPRPDTDPLQFNADNDQLDILP